jgi:hypothetical protein
MIPGRVSAASLHIRPSGRIKSMASGPATHFLGSRPSQVLSEQID